MEVESYSFIELTIDLERPVELYDLMGMFVAIGHQFEQYLRDEHPNLVDETSKIYVRQIRAGSIIADLIPFIPPLIENLDRVLIVDDFVRRYGGLILKLGHGQKLPEPRKSDLDDLMKGVAAIANDSNGSATLKSVQYDKDGEKTRVAIKFDTKQAQQAIRVIDEQRKELEAKAFQVVENQLLVFWQSNLKQTDTGKRTGELAIMEYITKKPLAVVYDSELAEQRIKHETSEGSRNLYRLGFYVTARVETLNGRPVAYRISEVHDIIELPDE
ncbi:hypothetical protein [Devosia sp.]|uniref:hypothetical protein n=1 Tax=Devosia sp. TaxID=1871048 RepID=UPI001B19B355|nr:hypothetical protein [Devosia sp.]MBO9589468.1 hypothetical protein [Devosia sp.]